MDARAQTPPTHECPAAGCEARVPFEQLACDSHWLSIPAPLRDQLTREWEDGAETYLETRAACLEVLGALSPSLHSGGPT